MTLYLDASAAVALILSETAAAAVRTAMERRGLPLILSDFAAAEVCSAVSLSLRTGRLTEASARGRLNTFDELRGRGWAAVTVSTEDIQVAEQLVRQFELKLRAPDAIHAAACLRLGSALATLDQGLAEAALLLGIEVVAITVGET